MSGDKKAILLYAGFIRRVLFPLLWLLSLIYGGILLVRNKLFDWGWLKENKYDLPVISIGNITVGGTGKTPLTEYVISLLKDKCRVALLSRGYKRKTKGVVIAEKGSTAVEIGDEPKQIQSKFPEITVVVAEKRREGIDRLLKEKTPDVIVLDDAYQHRYVKPGLSILMIDYNRPLWKDHPFPAGSMREPLSGKKRADIIIVSKCPPGLSDEERDEIIKKTAPDAGQVVFFTTVKYMPPENLSGVKADLQKDTGVVAVAGIAKPDPFFLFLSERYRIEAKISFPDHHAFSGDDCRDITTACREIKSKKKAIITTEKDFMRLKEPGCIDEDVKSHIWYIPIKVAFLFDEEEKFNQLIFNYVEKDKKYR